MRWLARCPQGWTSQRREQTTEGQEWQNSYTRRNRQIYLWEEECWWQKQELPCKCVEYANHLDKQCNLNVWGYEQQSNQNWKTALKETCEEDLANCKAEYFGKPSCKNSCQQCRNVVEDESTVENKAWTRRDQWFVWSRFVCCRFIGMSRKIVPRVKCFLSLDLGWVAICTRHSMSKPFRYWWYRWM